LCIRLRSLKQKNYFITKGQKNKDEVRGNGAINTKWLSDQKEDPPLSPREAL